MSLSIIVTHYSPPLEFSFFFIRHSSLSHTQTHQHVHTHSRGTKVNTHSLTDVCLWIESDVETKWKLRRQEDLSLLSTRDTKKETGTKLQWLIVALILTKALSGGFVLEAQMLIIDEIAVCEIRAEGTEKTAWNSVDALRWYAFLVCVKTLNIV